jgi:hypothetical protein
MEKIGQIALLIFLLFSAGMLIFGLPFIQADSIGDQAPETEAMDEVRSDQSMGEIEMGGSIEGVVTGVSPSSGTLAVRDDEEDDKTYYIATKKSTTYAGLDSISDINIGDSITVDCYGLEGRLVAETITLQERAHRPEEPEKLEKVLVD